VDPDHGIESDAEGGVQRWGGEHQHRERDQQREPIVRPAPEDQQGDNDDHRQPDHIEHELVVGIELARESQLRQYARFSRRKGERHRGRFARPKTLDSIAVRSGDRYGGDTDRHAACH
jgi:hypothetical protein